ncbi:MAG: hypothetical protein ACRC2T_15390 [Thermoguttaceae bacterium]
MPKNIPTLNIWKSPEANSLKDLIAGKSLTQAGDVIVDEIAKSLGELLNLLSNIQPTVESFDSNLIAISELQTKIKVLTETALFLAEKMPDDERMNWKNSTINKIGNVYASVANEFRSKDMNRAASEFGSLILNFQRPYEDTAEQLKTLCDEAPKAAENTGRGGMPSSSPMMSPPGGMPSPSPMMSPPGGMPGGAATGSKYAGFRGQCDNFFGAYAPGTVDEAKMSPILAQITPAAQTNLLGITPTTTNRGMSGSSSMYPGGGSSSMYPGGGSSSMYPGGSSSSMYPGGSSSSMYPSGGMGSTANRPRPGLDLTGGQSNQNMPAGVIREMLDDTVRKSMSLALKDMLLSVDPNSKIAPQIALAYCSFAPDDEDIVPAMATYLKKAPSTPEKFDSYRALVLQPVYSDDPRVQFLLVGMSEICSLNPQLITNANDIFVKAKGTSKFITSMLRSGNKKDTEFALQSLYEIGDGDSAVEVAKLLGSNEFGAAYTQGILDVLAETGDERVALPVLKLLTNMEYQQKAKSTLIRIGSPAEETVLKTFGAKRVETDKLALEILAKIGSWKSVSRLGTLLRTYANAKSEEELEKVDGDKSQIRVMDLETRNEMIQRTVEAGTLIIARLTGMNHPGFGALGFISPVNPNTTGRAQGMYGGIPSATPGGMSGTMTPGGMPGGMPGSMPSGMGRPGTQVLDPSGPRVLFTGDQVPPDDAPLDWMKGIAYVTDVKSKELIRILGKAINYESGRKAGEDATTYNWIEPFMLLAGKQAQGCVNFLSPDNKKKGESELSKMENSFKKMQSEMNRIKKSDRTFDGFKETYRSANQRATAGGRGPGGPGGPGGAGMYGPPPGGGSGMYPPGGVPGAPR